MKKITFSVYYLMIALLFACVMSCSEQDESPVSQDAIDSNSPSLASGKNQSKGARIEGGLDVTVGDPIDLITAKAWATNYRLKNPNTTRGHFFGNEIINQILNEEGCIGIRMYYGIDEKGNKQLMLVGVDSNGEDLLPSLGESLDGGGNIIGDASFPCPDYCPTGELGGN
jgi:hypothetical protein